MSSFGGNGAQLCRYHDSMLILDPNEVNDKYL